MAASQSGDRFADRHIGPRPGEIDDMLKTLGLATLDDLTAKTVPPSILKPGGYAAAPMSEAQALARLRAMADKNVIAKTMIGMGYSGCITPPVILRNVLENPGWYTAYTPYQAEISQGRMEALMNYQQTIIDLTGMELANASLLDEGTAAAEAMTLMRRVGKAKGETLFVDAGCHPQTIAVIETRAAPLGIPVTVGDPFTDLTGLGDGVYGVVLQYPATDGAVRDFRALTEQAHAAGALVTVAADLLSLVLLAPPGEWGADIVVGSAQRFGVPMGFGGPHAAFMAAKDAFKRTLPGRLIGVSIDSRGKPAYRMALQTREQHIRREKATSNICTAQVLLANIAGMYAVYHGPEGLTRIAKRTHQLTAALAAGLKAGGVTLANDTFFDTLTADLGDKGKADMVIAAARAMAINLRDFGDGRVGMALDETTDEADIQEVLAAFGVADAEIDLDAPGGIPQDLVRTTDFLTHPVFHGHRSETAMMRYLRKLEGKDLALNRAMIPLGSCTMKLNAAAEMIPITWPEFGQIHPFAPADQVQGYKEMIDDLERMLCEITGFDAVSLQPNAGSQGEYAGLLVIRAYHLARGDHARDVCLIPSSAHGTNPASAVMAGMKVVVVACDDDGNVDVTDLKAKAEAHKDALAALMVTYPSTHGVFEEAIEEICDVIHANGGQVYMDGANLQAMVGLCRPGTFGPDVAHMNLHKTFCIPHGGGGPGVGPIGIKKHLAPYLPGSPVVPAAGGAESVGAVSAAPWGSASILPISWTYIAMMGGDGLMRATQVAILNANYVAKRLAGYYDCLYTGKNGLVAHECIIDTRPLKDEHGVTVDDIAKRLIDYGFHAPTMSWPVAGTLMVEPTESEPKEELDRFVDAMIAIAEEAKKVGAGEWPADDNPLVNAPHTVDMVTSDSWSHAYSREQAAFPVPGLYHGKYWSPVGRVDNVYGDRHVVCTCPPLEAYEDAAE
ncbi:aminomethyl-transferring glycine dehydrogenase [Thalassospiraceae bacterium LMO-SO8]|nr:aminomethyl-transferring glycine dehydrogenase [Alphaproteobacteria bacterium LMO-S08]WND76560.1 aminomethyl-transferring glycine dehydrogenase [Thalassospiraceae bacterium LMO-SO8]